MTNARMHQRKNARSALVHWCVLALLSRAAAVEAQPSRLAVLQAEDRRAPTANDLAILRSGAHGGDAQTTRMAVRAMGRLERPALIADVTPFLRHALPEIRIEAATAIGQAAQGWKGDHPAPQVALDAAVAALLARLKVEADPDVRATICETIGRLPYSTETQVDTAERALIEMSSRSDAVADRLGIAKGFEALVRLQRKVRPPSDDALRLLRRLATPGAGEFTTGARVRRLAIETLVTAAAVDVETLKAVTRDPDAQVRRHAMRAAASPGASIATITAGLVDESPIVRIDALRSLRVRGDTDASCAAAASAANDGVPSVALTAIDSLADCGTSEAAVSALLHEVNDLSPVAAPRGWHRAAHALVALASASADRGRTALPGFTESRTWQVRVYAARAATILKERDALDRLAGDSDDNVREAAVDGLRKVADHAADAIYIAQLTRNGNQVVRSAALALEGTPAPQPAIAALRSALQRLVAEGRDNSHDARAAIEKTLKSLGSDPRQSTKQRLESDPRQLAAPQNDLNADDVRRLAAPRARVTMRGLGSFELALFTAQAPATVLRFAHLADSGYYNGLTFHRFVANFVIQGGSPGANEYVGDATFMRDEVGTWPHVRGAVGISTRGRDTGDAQIFIDLVDNPRLDHEYTVFAQVLNGIEIVDQILEGDVIERVEILP